MTRCAWQELETTQRQMTHDDRPWLWRDSPDRRREIPASHPQTCKGSAPVGPRLRLRHSTFLGRSHWQIEASRLLESLPCHHVNALVMFARVDLPSCRTAESFSRDRTGKSLLPVDAAMPPSSVFRDIIRSSTGRAGDSPFMSEINRSACSDGSQSCHTLSSRRVLSLVR